MPTPTREEMIAYARRWETLGPILDRLRDEDIRQADTQASIRMFDQAFRIALRDLPPRESSGLVEWQRWMHIWRNRLESDSR
jgi:hypothetical protein